MLVKCIGNDISFLTLNGVKERVGWWTNSDGKYNDLNIGQEYLVQAIEYLKDGVFYYLHTIDIGEHPYPYASELFAILDSSLPANWEVSYEVEKGRNRFKRLTFREWACDDLFFEKLVDGESEYVSIYLSNRRG